MIPCHTGAVGAPQNREPFDRMKLISLLLLVAALSACRSGGNATDVSARDRLLERIGNVNDFSKPRPLVSLEEFFEENTDDSSVLYNLSDRPSPQEFFQLLRTLRDKPEVSDVLVQVQDIPDPSGWPSTDTVWFITSAGPAEVRAWLPRGLAPDELFEGFEQSQSRLEPYEVPEGMRAVGIWYD